MKIRRDGISLDAGWKFHAGDMEMQAAKDGSTSCNASKSESARGAAAHGFYDEEWETVHLPHDYAVKGEALQDGNAALGYLYRGAAWYRRSFLLEEETCGKRICLHFDGVAGNAVVWVNGHLLHRNFDSFNDFMVDISSVAFFGNIPNTIAVLIDTEKYHMPEEMIEGWWYDGAGIYRHVWLEIMELVHIGEYGIYANPIEAGDNFQIPAQVSVVNEWAEEAAVRVEFLVVDDQGNQIVQAERQVTIVGMEESVVDLPVEVTGVKRWELDDPQLYAARACVYVNGVLMDQKEVAIGFRSIRFDPDHGFFLNGKAVKIKGTSNHQDHGVLGSGVTDGVMELRIARLKAMGCNAYRCAHNPVAPELLDLCDRYGMLIMSENRWFVPGEDHLALLKRLVKRERNHPSVIAWSIGNEEPLQCGEQRGTRIARELIGTVKKLDTTRPCTLACNGGYFEKGAVAECDVISMNYFPWLYDEVHALYPDRAILSSEASCSNNCRGVYEPDEELRRFTAYDHHAPSFGNHHRDAWKYVAEREFMSGIFFWTGYEYRGETMWPSLFGEVGMLDFNGFPKDNYYLMQALWLDTPVIHITPHWNFTAPKEVQVYVYSNGEEAELFLNGRSLGRKESDPYQMVSWMVQYEPGELNAVAYKKGETWASTQVKTTKAAVCLCIEEEEEAQNLHYCEDSVRVYRVYAKDEDGSVVPDAEAEISIELEGGAVLLGAGSSPIDPSSPLSSKRQMVHGLMQVIVRQGEKEGGVLRVSAWGLTEASAVVPACEETGLPGVVHYGLVSRWWSSVVFDTPRTPDTYKHRMPAEAGMPLALFSHETGYAMLSLGTSLPACDKRKTISILFEEITGEADIWVRKRNCSQKDQLEDADMLKENSLKKTYAEGEGPCCVTTCKCPCEVHVRKEESTPGAVEVILPRELFAPGESVTIWAGIKGEDAMCGLTKVVRFMVG